MRAKKSGKTSGETSFTWAIVVPSVSISSKPSNPSSSSSPSFSFASNATNATFSCRLDAGSFVACSSPKSYPGLAGGLHTFRARASGPTGSSAGTGPEATWTWLVDAMPPPTPVILLGPFPWPPIGWQSTNGTFIFIGLGDTTSFQCSLDGGAFVACSSPKSYSSLAQGQHVFRARAVDAAGNASTGFDSWTFFVDTVDPTKPVFSVTPPDPSPTATSTFAWSSTDPGHPTTGAGVAGYLCSKENGNFLPCSSPHTYNVPTTNNGQHQFAVVAIDWAGNVSEQAKYKWKVAAGTPANFTISGSVTGLLIGVWKSIPVTITNPNNAAITVTSLTVAVSGNPNGCSAVANFETRPSAVPFTVPANAVNYTVPPANQPQIRLANLASNQDNCKSQTISMSFSGSANGP